MSKDGDVAWESKNGEGSVYELGDEDIDTHLEDIEICVDDEVMTLKWYSK